LVLVVVVVVVVDALPLSTDQRVDVRCRTTFDKSRG